MITISLCMIVKNEEKVLERCLKSLVRIVDEIIIVDTGSNDKTKEMAQKYTDKIYDYAWQHDFSHARNFAFSKANMDYIYSADADEILDEANQKRFLQLKEILLPEIEVVQMKYCNQLQFNTVYNYDEEYRPKLFKRVREFKWIDPIHETIQTEAVVYDSDIEIIHCPECYHTKRDFGAFCKMEESGISFSKRLHMMYAKELLMGGEKEDFVNAIPTFQKTLEDTQRSQDEIKEATCVLGRAARLIGDTHAFFTNALKNVAMGSCAEICYELGEYYYSMKEYNEAIIWYYNAAYETECILDLSKKHPKSFEGLAKCYFKLGNNQKVEEYQKIIEKGY